MPHTDSPCDHCAAPCCRHYTVVLSGLDAYRMAVALKVPPEDFCELRWTEKNEGHYQILLSGAADAPRRYHRLVLRKVPDPDPRYEGRCVFLFSVGERGRCGAYDVRPASCALYPTSHRAGVIGLDGGTQYCPPGAWQISGLDVPLLRLQHQHRDLQRTLWDAVVRGWNERLLQDGLTADDRQFYAFVMNVYRALGERAPALLSDGEAPAAEAQGALALLDRALRELGWRQPAGAAPVGGAA